ncbi:MAG: tetratricopeptide repeat protein [Nitrospirae bacterium]|nr:tetratricopeptide repeat protein [Nitrospirota bacterium]
MKKLITLFILAAAITIAACSNGTTKEKPEAAATPPMPVLKVGIDPMDVLVLEQDTFHVPSWLDKGIKGRTLVRISAVDGLSAIAPDNMGAIKDAALKSADMDALANMGNALWKDKPLYSTENTVYVAHQLGIVDRVYWVVPRFGSITHEGFQEFKQYLLKASPGQRKDVDSLVLNGKLVEGTFDGMPVTFVGLQDLPALDGPVLLQVDISFLSTLYMNEKSTRILALVSGFFDTLKKSGIKSDCVTVVTSNANGLVPVKFRFLAGYLASMFKDPALIAKDPPALWSESAEAWLIEQKSPKESIAVYKDILKKYPEVAATHYDLSYAYFMVNELESCRKELAEAARLDPGYESGYAEFAAALREDGKKAEAEGFLASSAR